MHFCLECGEAYEVAFLPNSDAYDEITCPRVHCVGGDVVKLDEMIAPSIILLNQKGYFTKYCCSGHWYKASSYIYFEEGFRPEKELPKPFVWEYVNKEKGYNIMRAECEVKDETIFAYNWVYETNKDLFKWVNSLEVKES